MTNKIYLIILSFCLCFALVFVSCGKEQIPVETDTEALTETFIETVSETVLDTEPQMTETEEITSRLEEELPTPVENEKAVAFIEDRYEKATEAVEIAKKGALPINRSAEITTEEGKVYYPVSDGEARTELDGASIVSFADLSKYIKAIFARGIAEDLLDFAMENYTEIDGILCVLADSPASDTENEDSTLGEEEPILKEIEFFLSHFDEAQFRYTAKITYEGADQTDYLDFVFENTGTGWFWTAFPELQNR